MNVKRNTSIRYIYKGKQYLLKIVYDESYLNIVPIYYSDDIDDILVIITEGEMLPIVGSNYCHDIGKDTCKIELISSILNKEFNNKMIAYLHCANWYGYNNTINVISKLEDKETSEYIISKLNNVLLNNKKLDIRPEKDILGSIKYINVI